MINTKFAMLAIAAIFLAACSSSTNLVRQQQVVLTQDMQQSKQAYKACLIAHPENFRICEQQHLLYEADVQSVEAVNNGTMPAPRDSGKVDVRK